MKKPVLLFILVCACVPLCAQFKIELAGNVFFPSKSMADSPVYLSNGFQTGFALNCRLKKWEIGGEIVYQVTGTNFSSKMKKQGFYNSSMTIHSESARQLVVGAKAKWKNFKRGGIQLHAGLIMPGNRHNSTLTNGSTAVYNIFYIKNDHPGFVFQPGLFYDIPLAKKLNLSINAGYSISATKYTIYTEKYTTPATPPIAYNYKQHFFQLGVSLGVDFDLKKKKKITRRSLRKEEGN